MSLQVVLSSGTSIDTTAKPGAKVADLRQEVSVILNTLVGGIEILSGTTILEDHDEVPEGTVSVMVNNFPWLDDGSETIKDLGGCTFKVGGDPKKGSPVNALCDVGFSNGHVYFEVEVIAGEGPWIGVGTKQTISMGWKCKGLFFGGPGNLSNGAGLLQGGFGEKVTAGQIIGFSVDLTNANAVNIAIWQNDNYLGEAFKDCTREAGAMLYPVVRAQNVNDSFKISLRQKVRIHDAYVGGSSPHPAVGSWKLDRLIEKGDAVDITGAVKGKGKGKGGGITLNISPTPSAPTKFDLSLKMGNTVRFTVETTTADTGETLTVGPLMSTMMMVMGPMGDLENRINALLSSITHWSVTKPGTDGAELHLWGIDVEMVFSVDNSRPDPCQDNEALMPKSGGY